MKEPILNHKIAFRSALTRYQNDFLDYKTAVKNWFDCQFIDEEGNRCEVSNDFAKIVTDLENQLIIDRNDVEVERIWLEKEKEEGHFN